MRWTFGIFLLLGIAIGLACQIEISPSNDVAAAARPAWRLTPNGWQKVILNNSPAPLKPAESGFHLESPHPLVLSLFVILLSLFALTAFTPSWPTSKRPHEQDSYRAKLVQVELCSQAWLDGPVTTSPAEGPAS